MLRKANAVTSTVYFAVVTAFFFCMPSSYADSRLETEPASELKGIHWKLLDDTDLLPHDLLPGHPFSITFNKQNSTINVKDMCHEYDLTYSVVNEKLVINRRDVQLDYNSCSTYHTLDYLTQSQLYIKTLFDVNQYQISGGLLKLTTVSGKSMIFWSQADSVLTETEIIDIYSLSGPSVPLPAIIQFKDQGHFEELYSQELSKGLSTPLIDFTNFDVIGLFFGETTTYPVNVVSKYVHKVNDTSIIEINTLLPAQGCPTIAQSARLMKYLQIPKQGKNKYRFYNYTFHVGEPCDYD